MSDTRIERLEAWEVVVPAHAGAINSAEYGSFLGQRHGLEWDHWPICLIEITFSDGGKGLGEVGRGVTLAELRPWLESLVGWRPRGWSPNGLPAAWRGVSRYGGALTEAHPHPLWDSASPLFPALEMALVDWTGRRLGCRAVELVGGAYREDVPVDYWAGRKTPADLHSTVSQAAERGFTGIKIKSRLGDPVVEQVRAIRDAGGPEFGVTIDPMYQWLGPNEALGTLKSLEMFGPGIRVEDPFPEDQPEFWRRAREVCAVPMIWHARSHASLRRALQERVADGYNVCGGFADFPTAARAVEIAGYSCWRGSSLELGIGQIAGLHVAAASRACVMPSDFQSGVIRQHTLVEWSWPYRAGHLPLPDGPGLGVELDRDAVRHHQRAHTELRA